MTAYRDTAILVAFLLSAALAAAFAAEYGFGHAPCELCLTQRWPYYLGTAQALVIVYAVLSGKPRVAVQSAMLTLLAILAWSLYLGLQHAGIEWGWWKGPASCSDSGAASANAGDLLKQAKNTVIVPCDRPSFLLFGILSFAAMNALLSGMLFILVAATLAGFDPAGRIRRRKT